MTATCSAFSTFKSVNQFTPSYETRIRNIFGDKVDQVGGTSDPVSLMQGTSTFSLVLPKALKAQAYDVSVALVGTDESTSNTVNIHYVMRGASGTVQNAVFDKVNYINGDVAVLKILISDPADTFFGSRVGTGTILQNKTVIINITEKDGTACGSSTRELGSKEDYLTLNIPIIANCTNPSADVTFAAVSRDGVQQVLDSKTFTTPNVSVTESAVSPSTTSIIIIILCLILAAIIIFIYEKLHKK